MPARGARPAGHPQCDQSDAGHPGDRDGDAGQFLAQQKPPDQPGTISNAKPVDASPTAAKIIAPFMAWPR
jgi:hypothetical protein